MYLKYALFLIEQNSDIIKLVMDLYFLLPHDKWIKND